jgi:hypothetical protein
MEDEIGWECSTHEEDECIWVFVGKPEGKRPAGTPRHR